MTEIIGFTGFKGAGKDSAAQELIIAGYENVKFAGALKEMFRAFLRYIGLHDDYIEELVEGALKEEPMAFLGGKTSREFMQHLGTEFGRDLIWEDLWVNAAMMRSDQFDKVVITDVRFPNECSSIQEKDGHVYRIHGQDDPNEFSNHESEKYIAKLPVDGEIYNDGTLEDLSEEVHLRFLVAPNLGK